jgi:uncharacterized protein YcbK (DUF882 family)
MIDTVDHFPITEFACRAYHAPDGYHPAVPYPEEWEVERLAPLKRILEVWRLALGSHPMTVLCGYRTTAFNLELRRRGIEGERHSTGVALHSHHTEGRAADVHVFGVETVVLLQTILTLHDRGQVPELGGVGYYPRLGFVHVDTFKDPSGSLRRWNG